MSDDFEPFATAGSGKSEPEVAFDLLNKLKGQGVWGERNMPAILDMYAECLDAVKGLRAYEGQNRIYPVVKMSGMQKQTQTSLPPIPAPAQQPAQTQAAAPQTIPQPTIPPIAPPVAPPANPVQSQQFQLQQQLHKQG